MRESWRKAALGDLLERSTERLGDHAEPRILTVTEGNGLVDQLQHWGRRVATDDVRSYKVVQPDDIVYNVYLLWLGAIGQNNFGDVGITSPVYEVFRPRDGIDSRYLGLLVAAPSLVERYGELAIGTVPRRRRTPWQSFLQLRVNVPSLAEQRRIVDLVGALDDAIAAAESAAVSARKATVAVVGRPWDSSVRREPVARTIPYMLGGTWGSPPGEDEVDVMALGPRSYAGRLAVDESTATLRSLSTKRAADRVLQRGDIVLERSGGTATQPVGRVVRMTGDASNVVPSDFQRLLRPDPAIVDPGYLFWHLWAAYEAGRTIPFQKATTNIRNLNIPAYLAGTSIALPTMDAQREHAALADSFATTLERIGGVLDKFRTLRSNLLTVLLSGEHEIPESYDVLIREVA